MCYVKIPMQSMKEISEITGSEQTNILHFFIYIDKKNTEAIFNYYFFLNVIFNFCLRRPTV